MQEYTSHKPGTFCWVDLATTDTAGAKKFYNEVFGWEIQDIPVGEGMVYTMLNINGKAVAALAEMQPEQRQMGIPPYWMSYVAVEDAAATIAKARELGGNVLAEAFDVMEEGRMGLFTDPEGAITAVWQAKNHIGASYKNIPNTLCWVEHGSHNPGASIPFLEKVFDWKAVTQNMGGTDYTTFFIGEEMAGGLYVMQENMKDVPSHWLSYFLIENIDAKIEKITSLGGEILMPKMFAEGVGFFSVFRDPQGAVAGLVQGVE